MIKGINRQIIEVRQTGSIYYEKALLIVRPEFSSAQQQILEREAHKLLRRIDAPSTYRRKRIIVTRVILALGSALCSGLLVYFLFKFGLI